MIELFFSLLVVLCYAALGTYAINYERKALLELGLLLVVALFVIKNIWQLSLLFVFLLILSPSQRLKYSSFAAYTFFPALMLSFFLVKSFAKADVRIMLPLAIISVVAICALAIIGVFEDNLRRYLAISNAAQLLFVVLGLCIGKMAGGLVLGTVQIFNYTIAGLALFLGIGVLAQHRHRISELEGSYLRNRWNDIFAVIACLSLAGLPVFNMFAGEWGIFTSAFAVAPMIALLGVFAALMLLVMYYKIIYVLLVGEGKPIAAPSSLTAFNGFLAVSCIVQGIFPYAQWMLLSKLW